MRIFNRERLDCSRHYFTLIMLGLRGIRGDLARPSRHIRLLATKDTAKTVTIQEFLSEPAKFIVIPVTTKKIFVYHKHTSEILDDNSRIIRFERWINRKSGQIWDKMNKSPKSYNQKIVSFVNRLLDNTPWTENSLKSIPGEQYILKRVMNKDKESQITLKQFTTSKKPLVSKPLSVYYPSKSMSRDSVVVEFRNFYASGLNYHRKQLWLCILGIPLTLPLVLIPLIPNVPGFYLTYRAYSNFKAFLGAKHLKNIIEDQVPPLQFRDVEGYSEMVSDKRTVTSLKDQCSTRGEKLILNYDLMPRILDLLEIHELEPDLRKVIRQEQKRLGLQQSLH